MDLFTQLAQQTLGNLPSSITPRLAARFERAGADTESTSDTVDLPETWLNTQGDLKETPRPAVDSPDRSHDTLNPAPNLSTSAPSIHGGPAPIQPAGQALQASPHGARAGTVTAHRNQPADSAGPSSLIQSTPLRQPTIEPVLAPRMSASTENNQQRTPDNRKVKGSRSLVVDNTGNGLHEAAPAPVIRVSIGRVDVRAIVRPQEPARRERETPRSPTQTLDEYLRKERGGR